MYKHALITLLCAQVGLGATYHVATTGDNGNPGTEGQPFLTIQKFADVAVAGDTGIIHGGTYRETVTPASSGTVGSPIVFRAATGETPVVNGCDVVSGWTLDHDAVYSAAMAWTMERGSNQVFIDGVWLPEAQWPAQTNIFRQVEDFYTPTGGSCNSTVGTISDSTHLTQPDGYWDGATVFLNWSPRYHAITALVTSYSSGVLSFTFDSSSQGGTITSSGIYALYGHANALFAGSWYYDFGASRLRTWLEDGSDPTTKVVEVKRRRTGFDLSNRSFVTVDGIDLKACDLTTDNSSADVRVDNAEILFPTHYTAINYGLQGNGDKGVTNSGVVLKGNNQTIANSIIRYSAGNGVTLQGTNCMVTNCVISHCNYAGTEAAGVSFGCGVIGSAPSLSNTVINCTVSNVARAAIAFTGSKNPTVSGNTIREIRHGRVCSDLGAIYGIRQNDGVGDFVKALIVYNNVIHAENTIGIYLDIGCTNVTIAYNRVRDTGDGNPSYQSLYCNSPADNVLMYNNTCDYLRFFVFNSVAFGANIESKNNVGRRIYDYPAGVLITGNNIHLNDVALATKQAMFVDYDIGDWRPRSVATTIIDQGATLGLSRDILGRGIFGVPDIGCYEYWPPSTSGTLRVNSIRGR